MYNPKKSLNNAEGLLDANNIQEVISLRIEPEPLHCCCSHCWPLVWEKVNALIYPQGPVQHEGRAVIKVNNEDYVLEQHESGPEILLLITASLNLITAVMNMIAVSLMRKLILIKTYPPSPVANNISTILIQAKFFCPHPPL